MDKYLIGIEETVNTLVTQVGSLCDDEHIKFSYYDDLLTRCYVFKFKRHGLATQLRISYDDLYYLRLDFLQKKLTGVLTNLYDTITGG